MRHGIPTSWPASPTDPTRNGLAWYDCLEMAILTMPQDAFNEHEANRNLDAIGRGEATGDPRVDDFVRSVNARRKAKQEASRG